MLMRIIGAKTVKTRKVHNCVGCERNIPAGTKMNVVTYTDGDIFHAYWCPVCQHILDETLIEDEFIPEGEVKNGNREHWEEIRREVEDGKGKEICP